MSTPKYKLSNVGMLVAIIATIFLTAALFNSTHYTSRQLYCNNPESKLSCWDGSGSGTKLNASCQAASLSGSCNITVTLPGEPAAPGFLALALIANPASCVLLLFA